MAAQNSLSLSGADLVYSTQGTGPLLLPIPGANGTAQIFTALSKALASHFTVCTYDRRGFSRSKLTGDQNYATPARLARDADDAAAILAELSPDKPAYIFGTSSGAIVAQEVVKRHPALVERVVLHEPPLARLLGEEGGKLLGFWQSVYDTYQAKGIKPAIEQFVSMLPPSAETEAMRMGFNIEANPSIEPNVHYWFEHELTKYTAVESDIATLRNLSEKLVVAVGEDSVGPLAATSEVLAAETGARLAHLPGGHVGYVLKPDDFASRLRTVLLADGKL